MTDEPERGRRRHDSSTWGGSRARSTGRAPPPRVGLTVRIRRHRLRGGWTALISSGLAAAGGVLLVVMVPVGLATGGLSIGRPEGVSIALFAVWMVLFGGTGIALRRE